MQVFVFVVVVVVLVLVLVLVVVVFFHGFWIHMVILKPGQYYRIATVDMSVLMSCTIFLLHMTWKTVHLYRCSQLPGRLLDVVFPHMGRSVLDYVSGTQTLVLANHEDVRLEKDQNGFSVGPFISIQNVIPDISD